MAKRLARTEPVLLTLPDAIDLIRFEKNLLQIGFFGAHERRGKQATSRRRIEQWVNRDGKKIKVSAEFRSSDALGLPSTSDRDKYMAFMKLAMETRVRNGIITNPIRFSGYSLLNALGQCDSGENYEALNSWGMRMADTTITSEQVIYSSLRKRYMNKTVHVFRSFTRLGSSNLDGSNKVDLFEVELEDWLLENLNEAFVVPEDFNMYRKLVRPTAKGIFVYLYLWFFASQGKEVEKDYSELCALLNVRAYDHVSKIRETMGLSLTDLVNIGYLKSWDIRPMSSKIGYKLILAPGQALKDVLLLTQRKQLAFAAAHLESPLTAIQEQLKSDLVGHGISPIKAVALVRKTDANALQDRLDYAGAQLAADRKGNIKNPAGYVITFIESDQTIPSSFETRSQKEAAGKRKAEKSAQEKREQERTFASMQMEQEYANWCKDEADAHIAREFDEDLLLKRLRTISNRLRETESMGRALSGMTPTVRKAELMRLLRKEVLKEIHLPPIDEWIVNNPQGDLF